MGKTRETPVTPKRLQRIVITRLYDDGWTPREIARKLRVPVELVLAEIGNILKRTA
jgi:hypothetical protein